MRNILLSIFLLLVLVVPVEASNRTFDLLTDATSTGPGTQYPIINAYVSWGCDVTLDYTTGDEAYTAVVVRIEGNQGGTVFASEGMAIHTLDATELSERAGSFAISSHPQKQIRANLTTLTATGTTPAVTVRCTGVDS